MKDSFPPTVMPLRDGTFSIMAKHEAFGVAFFGRPDPIRQPHQRWLSGASLGDGGGRFSTFDVASAELEDTIACWDEYVRRLEFNHRRDYGVDAKPTRRPATPEQTKAVDVEQINPADARPAPKPAVFNTRPCIGRMTLSRRANGWYDIEVTDGKMVYFWSCTTRTSGAWTSYESQRAAGSLAGTWASLWGAIPSGHLAEAWRAADASLRENPPKGVMLNDAAPHIRVYADGTFSIAVGDAFWCDNSNVGDGKVPSWWSTSISRAGGLYRVPECGPISKTIFPIDLAEVHIQDAINAWGDFTPDQRRSLSKQSTERAASGDAQQSQAAASAPTNESR